MGGYILGLFLKNKIYQFLTKKTKVTKTSMMSLPPFFLQLQTKMFYVQCSVWLAPCMALWCTTHTNTHTHTRKCSVLSFIFMTIMLQSISWFLSTQINPYLAQNCILIRPIKSYHLTKLPDGSVNYFWHKNLKNGKTKKLFFASNDPKMNLFMTLWYII